MVKEQKFVRSFLINSIDRHKSNYSTVTKTSSLTL